MPKPLSFITRMAIEVAAWTFALIVVSFVFIKDFQMSKSLSTLRRKFSFHTSEAFSTFLEGFRSKIYSLLVLMVLVLWFGFTFLPTAYFLAYYAVWFFVSATVVGAWLRREKEIAFWKNYGAEREAELKAKDPDFYRRWHDRPDDVAEELAREAEKSGELYQDLKEKNSKRLAELKLDIQQMKDKFASRVLVTAEEINELSNMIIEKHQLEEVQHFITQTETWGPGSSAGEG